jgi:putative oxidoreductase
MFKLFPNSALLLLRFTFSALMLTHGVPKIEILFNNPTNFTDPIGWGGLISLILTLFAEIICPVLIIIGFKARFFAIPVVITMAVASFLIHFNDSIFIKEKALLFLFGFSIILLAGPGKYAITKK